MAQIKSFPLISHFRAEASSHVRYFRRGKLRREGRGLAFWFDPGGASISEVPLADRDLTFMVRSQSADFQDVAVQGTILWHVTDAARLSDRVDFTVALASGVPVAQPEDHIKGVLTGLVRKFADSYVKGLGVRALLQAGLAPLQAALTRSPDGRSRAPTAGHRGTLANDHCPLGEEPGSS